MKDCSGFSLLLSLQLDDMLPEQDSAALEEHLAHCPDCRALQAELAQLHGDMTALSVPPPPGLSDAVMASIRAERAPRTSLFTRYRSFWASAAVFALLVSAIALGQGLSHGDEKALYDMTANQGRGIQPFAAEESPMEDITYSALEPGGEGGAGEATAPGTFTIPETENLEAAPAEDSAALRQQEPLSPEGEAALKLLYAHLENTNPSWELIAFGDFDESRGIYRFIVSYPDQTQVSYEVSLYNSGIFRLDDTP